MKWINRGVVCLFGISILLAGYLMLQRAGGQDGLDFGSGQYYYTDIPNWPHYFSEDHYEGTDSLWFPLFLFFIWGIMMVKLWIWVDRRWTNNH